MARNIKLGSPYVNDTLNPKTPLSERWAQMSHQAQIIEKKKLEIQAKLESKKHACLIAQAQKACNTDESIAQAEIKANGITNIFSNDGSFLDHFKKLTDSKKDEENPPPKKVDAPVFRVKKEFNPKKLNKEDKEENASNTANESNDRDDKTVEPCDVENTKTEGECNISENQLNADVDKKNYKGFNLNKDQNRGYNSNKGHEKERNFGRDRNFNDRNFNRGRSFDRDRRGDQFRNSDRGRRDNRDKNFFRDRNNRQGNNRDSQGYRWNDSENNDFRSRSPSAHVGDGRRPPQFSSNYHPNQPPMNCPPFPPFNNMPMNPNNGPNMNMPMMNLNNNVPNMNMPIMNPNNRGPNMNMPMMNPNNNGPNMNMPIMNSNNGPNMNMPMMNPNNNGPPNFNGPMMPPMYNCGPPMPPNISPMQNHPFINNGPPNMMRGMNMCPPPPPNIMPPMNQPGNFPYQNCPPNSNTSNMPPCPPPPMINFRPFMAGPMPGGPMPPNMPPANFNQTNMTIPNNLTSQSNPKLDSASNPPPEPISLQHIPPPLPISLNEIPKPKELDPCSIPAPPSHKVLSTDGAEADGPPGANQRPGRDLCSPQDSRSQDHSTWYEDDDSVGNNEYDRYYDKPSNKQDNIRPEDKYEPELCLEEDSDEEGSKKSDDEKPKFDIEERSEVDSEEIQKSDPDDSPKFDSDDRQRFNSDDRPRFNSEIKPKFNPFDLFDLGETPKFDSDERPKFDSDKKSNFDSDDRPRFDFDGRPMFKQFDADDRPKFESHNYDDRMKFEQYSAGEESGTKSDRDDDSDQERNESKGDRRKRARKSRWGEDSQKSSGFGFLPVPPLPPMPPLNIPSLLNMPLPAGLPPIIPLPLMKGEEGPMLTKITRKDPALLQYAKMNYGSINLDEEDWVKCEENFKLNLLYQDMVAKRQQVQHMAAAGKNKYEYDSDEDVEDGTWEHKLRTKEMDATKKWAAELTKQAAGKHHIGDFLPPEELKKFMEKYSSVKGGKEPDLSDYKEFKLKEDNIGFQMLQKLGWNEGQGLGAEGGGITQPINNSTVRDNNQGLGLSRVDNPEANDDEFDAYRKRMMLAYRFRPNPLNNPRRPYY